MTTDTRGRDSTAGTSAEGARVAGTDPRPDLSGPEEPHAGQRGRVFVYVGDSELAGAFADIGDGLVLHGRAGRVAAREMEPPRTVVWDPERYKEDLYNPDPPDQLFPPTPSESVQAQLDAGVGWLLSPSGFPRDRSIDGLDRVMDDGAAFIDAARALAPQLPAFVTVVIRFDELANGTWIDTVQDAGLPIATVFAGYADPLGKADHLEGAIALLRAAPSSLVLRCDTSVAGLMACGATAGAIGTSSSVRHLWLPSSRKMSNTPATYVYCSALNAWMKTGVLHAAEAEPDLGDLWGCNCLTCGPNGDIRRLADPGVSRVAQDRHSMDAAISMTKWVLSDPAPPSRWRTVCQTAMDGFDRLRALGIAAPAPPPVLSAWLRVLPRS